MDDNIIVELKAAESLKEEHKVQLINYLKAADKEVGLLLNFGKTPEFKRAIFTNDRKNHCKLRLMDNADLTYLNSSVKISIICVIRVL